MQSPQNSVLGSIKGGKWLETTSELSSPLQTAPAVEDGGSAREAARAKNPHRMHFAQRAVLSSRDRTTGDGKVLIEADSAAIMQHAVVCSSAGRSQRWRRDLLAGVSRLGCLCGSTGRRNVGCWVDCGCGARMVGVLDTYVGGTVLMFVGSAS